MNKIDRTIGKIGKVGTVLAAIIFMAFGGVTHAALPIEVPGSGRLPSLADMLEGVNPAVVNIATSAKASYRNPLFEDPFFRRFFRVPPQNRSRPVSSGSGVVIDAENGYIVTNSHVVEGADKIEVGLSDGRTVEAELVGRDPHVDLAVLKVEADNLVAVDFADSSGLRVGDFVVAIGNPFNLKQTVTSGIVSALGRTGLGIEGYEDFIQTDASINPGNSGGALVDLRGDLVGINTAILAPNGGNVGIGFAIPGNMVQPILAQLITHGEVRRGLVGVAVQDLHPELAEAFGVSAQSGVIVTRVEQSSPAERAGLQDGDIIQRIDQRDIDAVADFHSLAAVVFIGNTIEVSYLRDGRIKTVDLKISEETQQQVLGRQLHPHLDGVSLENFWSPEDTGMSSGVLVTEVEAESRAFAFGLRAGDVVVGLNRANVRDISQLRDTLQSVKKRVTLNIYRNGRFGDIFIR
jgi:Do/DeqQ family serine protease